MKSTTLSWITATALFAVLATPVQSSAQQQDADPPPHYIVTDLGTLGGTSSIAFGINNGGRVIGGATVLGGNEHPFLWYGGQMTDLGTLGGPNGYASEANARDELAVVAETPLSDPFGEDFCGFGTHLICLGAVWRNGVMTPLPTLGGNNGEGNGINERGQVVGVAENGTNDKSCASPSQPSQVFRYEAVLWGPKQGDIQELPPLPGDTVGFAFGINAKGEVVGATGTCANTPLVPLALGPHAVLWENGVPTDLGNLGGKLANTAAAINNLSQVVGFVGSARRHSRSGLPVDQGYGYAEYRHVAWRQVGFAGGSWRDQQYRTGGW